MHRRTCREGRIRRFGIAGRKRGVAGGLFAVVALAASFAAAHTAAVAIPPAGDYMIRWYQPHAVRPVDNWEIEIATKRFPNSPYLVSAQVVPDPSCWALNVPVNEAATVRVRSVAGSQVSAWSRPTVVPEIGTGLGTLVTSGALAALARRRRRGRRESPEARG